MSRQRCLPSNFMNLNPAGFSKSDMSSSWEEVSQPDYLGLMCPVRGRRSKQAENRPTLLTT
jgi:hypothetical protein